VTEPLWTAEDVASLKKAVASGILTVTYDGPPKRSQTFQSLAEMRSLLAEMVGQVAQAEGSSSPRFRRVRFRRGLGSTDG
jgi:predicted Zn-dependent peptidase